MKLVSARGVSLAAGIGAAIGVFLALLFNRNDTPSVESGSARLSSSKANDQPREALAPGLLDATAVSMQSESQRLLLVETIPGRTPREGSALIGTDPRSPQRYMAGAVLLNGARLTEIHNRYVVLERGTQTFRLELAGAESKGDTPSPSPLALVGGEQQAVALPEPEVDRVSQILRLAPQYEGDLLVGARLYPGTRGHLFMQLGLKSGDVLIAIDGAPIADASALTVLLAPLTDGSQMQFTVRRNSHIQQILLDGAIVSAAFDSDAVAVQALPAAPQG